MDFDNTKFDQGLHTIKASSSTANMSIDDVKGSRAFLNSDREAQLSTDALQDGDTLPKHLTLDVGGRTFKVSRDMLLDYGYFRHKLLGKCTWTPEPDGSYFFDSDPDLFEHLLRYMRRPAVLPLFYNNTIGFDYDLYNRLEKEAESFQLWALNAWIRDKVSLIYIGVC